MTDTDFQMTPEIAAAVCKVMTQVRRLEKAEKNKYDNYNFTSVDNFLEFVNPLMAEAGLCVLYQELEHEYYTNKKESLWMRVRYAFHLCHESGAVAGPFNRTVAVPMTGAQSYGSAQSYALKQFMRATFLIPTGEKDDADHNAKDDHQAAPPKRQRKQWQPGEHAAKGPESETPFDEAPAEANPDHEAGVISTLSRIHHAKDLDALAELWRGLYGHLKADQRVVEAKDKRKRELQTQAADPQKELNAP